MKTAKMVDYWLYSHEKVLSIDITPETMEKLFEIGDGEDTVWCKNADYGFICTRTKDHTGPHIATSKYDVCALWPQK